MIRGWTFGRKIICSFGIIIALMFAAGLVSVLTLRTVVSSKDRIINVNSGLLVDAQSLSTSAGFKSSAIKGYLLTGDQTYITGMNTRIQAFSATLNTINKIVSTPAERNLVTAMAKDETVHQNAANAVIAMRKTGAPVQTIGAAYEKNVDPTLKQLDTDIASFTTIEQKRITAARKTSSDDADTAIILVSALAGFALLIAGLLAFFLTRTLRRQIGSAVGEVKSSSTELQATANQQATGAKEQATAMSEITTTISELLATSRQIAESAQRVAQVAEQTATAGRTGELTIAGAQASIADIRRQVDVIVDHMLQLGEKSQQIGSVLDIVTELAEQTNILAINSTIEAAGAGEAGKRFAVVADEIRKLADRVANSTKEIRGLIDVVRSAVNTTVMATEIGSKAVDAGGAQFTEVANAFREIAGLVSTTTDAAREIELSTKQQTTAVEQVNVAISSVAQSSREAETSSTQSYQTASQLTILSDGLARLVVAGATS
jgi:methyl-accepting chemotaxis protein